MLCYISGGDAWAQWTMGGINSAARRKTDSEWAGLQEAASEPLNIFNKEIRPGKQWEIIRFNRLHCYTTRNNKV